MSSRDELLAAHVHGRHGCAVARVWVEKRRSMDAVFSLILVGPLRAQGQPHGRHHDDDRRADCR
jgi:hypothetical protein